MDRVRIGCSGLDPKNPNQEWLKQRKMAASEKKRMNTKEREELLQYTVRRLEIDNNNLRAALDRIGRCCGNSNFEANEALGFGRVAYPPNEIEYRNMMNEIETLMEADPEVGSINGERLLKLAKIAEAYERVHYPTRLRDL